MFIKDAIAILTTTHLRLVEPMDRDPWETQLHSSNWQPSCNLRRKKVYENLHMPTPKIKMGKMERELEVPATVSMQSQGVCGLTQMLLVGQSAAEIAAWLYLIYS